MSFGRADEDDGKIANRRGRHGRQQNVAPSDDGPFNHC